MPAAAETASNEAVIQQQADWILQAQLPDGAIAAWPDKPVLRLIAPYGANMAAAGLARATQVTGDPSYAEHAWQYLDWYASVEDPTTGYVTDYTVQNGTTPVSNGNIDSTDAYAGTFLTAAWDTYYVTRDQGELQRLAGGIAGALHAIESTQQPDGLTWAKPSWQVAYLMDNAQALAGLEGNAALESALGNTALAEEAAGCAAEMRQGIADLWDPTTQAYDWAEQANGWRHATDWSNFYPDAMEQAFAVLWGAVTGQRASLLMQQVVTDHPDWDQPTADDNFLDNASVIKQPVGYWPSVGSALTAAGDASLGQDGVAVILLSASQVSWAWPYTTANAGDTIVAASGTPYLDPTGSGTASPATATVPTTTTTVPATTTTSAPATTATRATPTTTPTTVPATTTTSAVPTTTTTAAPTTTTPATTTTPTTASTAGDTIVPGSGSSGTTSSGTFTLPGDKLPGPKGLPGFALPQPGSGPGLLAARTARALGPLARSSARLRSTAQTRPAAKKPSAKRHERMALADANSPLRQAGGAPFPALPVTVGIAVLVCLIAPLRRSSSRLWLRPGPVPHGEPGRGRAR